MISEKTKAKLEQIRKLSDNARLEMIRAWNAGTYKYSFARYDREIHFAHRITSDLGLSPVPRTTLRVLVTKIDPKLFDIWANGFGGSKTLCQECARLIEDVLTSKE